MSEGIDFEILDGLVNKILHVEDRTLGTDKLGYLVRYRGHLRAEDSEKLYDQLAEELKPMRITPLFRWDDDRHSVLLVPGQPEPKPGRPWLNLLMFVLTLLSVLLTGGMYGYDGELPTDLLQAGWIFLSRGWPFAISMLAILGTHEFGHYLVGRKHGVNVSLPFFIPMPFSLFGTMGAFINMKSIPKNRKALLDIGVAGPLAGMVVAVPVLALGLHLSALDALPVTPPAGMIFQLEGNSLLYLLMKFVTFGQLLPAPESYGVAGSALYWLRYFFTGHPLPMGGVDVMLHPVAWAGWAGLLVTSLNLIPAGQLDGGHITYVLFGRNAMKRIWPLVLLVLGLLGLVWTGWFLWAALIFFLGRVHAEPLDTITPLDEKRKWLGRLALLVFILTFTPVPLIFVS
jgi:membrane-associated protease RseP (regulator of RpoE activity)